MTAYTFWFLPSTADRRTVEAPDLATAMNEYMRQTNGESWSDGPDPWLLTILVSRESEPTMKDALAKLREATAMVDYYVWKSGS